MFLANILLFLISCTSPVGNENTTLALTTSLGTVKIRLYDNTPVHRDNFIKLVKSGFYDGVSFHRVIEDFMIQAGDPSTRTDSENLPDSLYSYTLPAEFRTENFHKKGVLAAAREGNEVNPEMRSSGTQFYIVQGTRLTDEEIDLMEQRMNSNLKQAHFNQLIKTVADSAASSGKPLSSAEVQEIASIKMFDYLSSYEDFNIPEEHRDIYMTLGGVPRLDGTYTVFGEVIEGLDVVDKIASVETDSTDRPLNDVRILKIRIVKN